MTAVIIALHIIVCIALICIVLLQTGKGASLGAAFGGSTQTVFGATGSAGFFEKVTTGVAIVFMLTSLLLTYMSAKQGGETIMEKTAPVEAPAPSASADDVWPEAAMPEEGAPAESAGPAGEAETAPAAPAAPAQPKAAQ